MPDFDLNSALTPAPPWECQLTKCDLWYMDRGYRGNRPIFRPIFRFDFQFSFKGWPAGTYKTSLRLTRSVSGAVGEQIGRALACNYASSLNNAVAEPATLPLNPDKMLETLCLSFGNSALLYRAEILTIAELIGGVDDA